MSEWAKATTMSMAGPVTCSALTVIDPVFPPDEPVCSSTMRLIPPGNETARFGGGLTRGYQVDNLRIPARFRTVIGRSRNYPCPETSCRTVTHQRAS
jgi:hypothetical protein